MTEALRALAGPGVHLASRAVGAVSEARLHPLEREAVARAIDKRRREMAAGREAARDALVQLGLAPTAIPVGPGGAPRWPAGVVGSITHTEAWALAAVARAEDARGLGIDAEPDAPLEAELWESITTAAELTRLRAAADAPRLARRLFCVKEAAYKCQFPLSGQLLEFTDLEVAIDPVGRFAARYARPAPPFVIGDTIAGRVGMVDGRWVAIARL